MANFYGQRPQQLTVMIEDLEVDSYQRPIVEMVVRKITSDFDPQALGGIIVNRRQDGRMFIVDGQQRVEALKRMGHQMADVLLLDGLTVEQEARLFTKLNGNRKSVEAIELFKARLSYGDPIAVEIAAIAERYGYKIQKGYGATANGIAAVRALEIVHKAGGADLLDRTLGILRAAWDDEPEAVHRYTIAGMGAFLRRYDGLVDTARLISRLRSKAPSVILRKASAEMAYGKGLDLAFAMEVASLYNWKLQGHRLPAWDEAPARQRDLAMRLSA